jgi:enoyl-CoA hydratase/carnithine racemase
MSIVVQRRGDIGILLLDEPKTRHALSKAMVVAALEALESDALRTARALVIGSMGPFFCAGANMNDLLAGWMDGSSPESDPVRLFERLADDSRVVIAAVDGGALGGGFELMLSCDLAVAGAEAWFCLPELQHGVIPNTGLMRMQQLVGLRTMMFYTMTGDRLTVQQALSMGLVNEVVANGGALDAAVALAQRIVNKVAPGAAALAKRVAHQHAQTDWRTVDESLRQAPAGEWDEGLQAFTSRRVADYTAFWEKAAKKR